MFIRFLIYSYGLYFFLSVAIVDIYAQENTIVVKPSKSKNKKENKNREKEASSSVKSKKEKSETSTDKFSQSPSTPLQEKNNSETLEPIVNRQVKDGFAVTGLPLVGYTSDWGVTYGARIIGTYYDKNMLGYNYQFWLQFFTSTQEYSDHAFNFVYNAPSATSYKLRAGVRRNNNANYFGYGNFQDIPRVKQIKSNRPIQPIGANILQSFQDQASNNAVDDALIDSQNRFFNYRYSTPYLDFSVEDWFNGSNFKWFVGILLNSYTIQSYNKHQDIGTILPKIPTLIDLENPVGYDAVIDNKPKSVNYLRLAFSYDSRPRGRESNPDKGIFTDVHIENSSNLLGSNYNFSKITYTYRQYYSFQPEFWNPKKMEWIFAYRVLLNSTFGGTPPFFEAGYIRTISEFSQGLGGVGGLRGFADNQFIDNFMALLNLELRWTFYKSMFLGGVDWQWVVFYDVGRVAPNIQKFAFNAFHKDLGLGLNFIWDQNAVIRFLGGFSEFDRYIALTFQTGF